MAIKRPNVSFKTRNDVFDSITPNCVVQPDVAVPAGEWKPARYLPVQWTGEASKDGFIISKGKVVCLDNAGRIADMFFKAQCAAAVVGGTVVTYDSTDVEFGVFNIATGEPAAAGVVLLEDVAQGLLDQGLVVIGRDILATDFTNGSTFNPTLDADCRLVCDAMWSEPMGVAAYDIFAWAGDAPAELVYNNYQKQHLIQFFTEVQMRAPLVVAAASATATVANGPVTATTFVGGTAGQVIELSALLQLERYNDLTGSTMCAVIVDSAGIAQNTDRTPITCSVAGVLVNQKSSADLIHSPGDFFVDSEVGLVFIHSTNGSAGNSQLSAGGDIVHYPLAGGASTQYKYIHAIGPVRPGDSLTYDAFSNFVKASAGDTIIGRVLSVEAQPKGLLDRVSTAWHGSSFNAAAKMPGSATKGFTDMITLSDESVADQIITINVRV